MRVDKYKNSFIIAKNYRVLKHTGVYLQNGQSFIIAKNYRVLKLSVNFLQLIEVLS